MLLIGMSDLIRALACQTRLRELHAPARTDWIAAVLPEGLFARLPAWLERAESVAPLGKALAFYEDGGPAGSGGQNPPHSSFLKSVSGGIL